ncbi:hypothetical protein [Leptospira sp. GIMC2001]|uniref:hypothetical protein n=1 Tax=Leptospira sp. GIMC2001 TaxID=1513297 RepID=UPI00234BD18D|nr:hypothetical protein [Leptospira sp. GIMC2001]WCL48600.1 hypothetical protein O4O04_14995 [Leptospira sp. GIMC2001]
MKIDPKHIHIIRTEGDPPSDVLNKFPIVDPLSWKAFAFFLMIYLVFVSIVLGIVGFALSNGTGDFLSGGLILAFVLTQIIASPLIYILVKLGFQLLLIEKNNLKVEAQIIYKVEGIYSAGKGKKRITTPISLIGLEFQPRNRDRQILFYTTTIQKYEEIRILTSHLIAYLPSNPKIWTWIK